MTIVQSILILEHTFHNYRQFRVTQWFLFRILGTLKLMSLQDIQWKWRGGFGLHSWNRFPMQYVLSSLDDCILLLAFVSHAKANTELWFPFAQEGHYNPDQTHLSCLSHRPWFLPTRAKVHHKNALSRPIGFLALVKSLTLKSFQGLNPHIKCLVTVIWYELEPSD